MSGGTTQIGIDPGEIDQLLTVNPFYGFTSV